MLIELFEAQWRATPDAVALRSDARCWSYQQLRGEAASLAVCLHHAGVAEGARVGLLAPRGVQMVRGMLAALYCGAAYVPMDVGASDERLRALLPHAGIDVVCGSGARRGCEGLRQLPLEAHAAAIPAGIPQVRPGATACVLYDWRGTGKPRGRALSHRKIARMARAEEGGLVRKLCVLWSGSRASNASTLEVWGPLLHGGEVVLVDETGVVAAHRLGEPIGRYGAGRFPRPGLKAAC